MKKFILFLLLTATPLLKAGDWENYKNHTLLFQKSIPGWCCAEKCQKLMDLIYATQPTTIVEVGVFGGSSVFPMARALKYNKHGVIYAIDPWSNAECLIGYDSADPNYKWWNEVNLEKIYLDFVSLISSHKLQSYCTPLRMTAQESARMFDDESIDILHIDGNHTSENAYNDAQLFLPKVKKGGYIWFDDANWSSTSKAIAYLLEYCTLYLEGSVQQDCLLMQKN